MEKKQLGIIFGSRSCEREVSVISAVQMMHHIDRERYDAIPVYIDEDGVWYTGEALEHIETFQHFGQHLRELRKVRLDMTAGAGALLATEITGGLIQREKTVIVARIDVFVVVMHGLNGEDGTLQGMLELANIPYSSTGVGGSAIGMDKILMKQFFRGAGLPVLEGEWTTRGAFQRDPEGEIERIGKALGYPVFVKPANLGSSIGVSRADNPEELRDSLELAVEYDRRILIERGLNHPLEFNCSVLGYDDEVEASPIEMPISGDQFLDFHEKYLSGGGSKGMASLHRVLPAPIGDELKNTIQETSKRIFRMLDCKGVVRIDYMYDRESESLYITEINTIPGSLSFYLWENAGLRYSRLIDRLVDYAEKAHAEKNASNYAYSSDILNQAVLGSKGAKGSKTGMGRK